MTRSRSEDSEGSASSGHSSTVQSRFPHKPPHNDSHATPIYWSRSQYCPGAAASWLSMAKERASEAGPSAFKAYNTVRAGLILSPWLIQLLATDIILSLFLPLSYLFPSEVYNISSRLASSVWLGIQRIFTRDNSAHITTSGVLLPHGESAIVISNHVSWSDFYMIQHLAIRSGMLGRCRWFAKQQLKWVPFLGWGLWAMGMPLVSREWTKDKKEMDRIFQGVKKNSSPIWLISYSEATRYTREKYLETIEWCKAHSRPIPRYTLYPRTKGFVTTVQQLRHTPHVNAVYDLTIAYAHDDVFMEGPSMWETLSQPNISKNYRFHIHAERFPLDALPASDEKLARWLEERWVEKGLKLESLRQDLGNGIDWQQRDTKVF